MASTPTNTIEPGTAPVALPRIVPVGRMWHTALLVVMVIGVSLLSASQHGAAQHQPKLILYATTFTWEWLLLAFVWWSVRHSGGRLRDLINARWSSPEMALLDLALAAGFWLIAAGVLVALSYAVGLADKNNLEAARKSLTFLVPGTRLEVMFWLALSMTAGFCEEIIFRGYLQRQFAALTQTAWGGIICSAIVFGFGHGYEGARRMLIIAVYGAMFGVLAHYRKSLAPGMVAHAWHDGFAGVMLHIMRPGG